MTPEARMPFDKKDPHQASLSAEIASHIAAFASGEMPLGDYVEGGLVLAAKRLDEKRSAVGGGASLSDSLGRIQEEDAVKNAFGRGFAVRRIPWDINNPRPATVKPVLIAIDNVFGAEVIDKIYIEQHFRMTPSFYTDLSTADLPDDVRAAASLLRLSYAANSRIHTILYPLLTDPVSTVMEGKEDDFWRSKLVGDDRNQGIMGALGYITKIRPLIDEKFEDIYLSDSGLANTLWKGVALAEIKSADKKTRSKRLEIINALGDTDVQKAEELMKELMVESPDLFNTQTNSLIVISDEEREFYRELIRDSQRDEMQKRADREKDTLLRMNADVEVKKYFGHLLRRVKRDEVSGEETVSLLHIEGWDSKYAEYRRKIKFKFYDIQEGVNAVYRATSRAHPATIMRGIANGTTTNLGKATIEKQVQFKVDDVLEKED